MRSLSWFPFVFSLALASPGAATVVSVKGSDTIGGVLGQEIARSFEAGHPGVEVKWEALGSATAFVGLFDGSAQLGAASRSVNEKELAEAKRLGLSLNEFVIGYDGVAVIVHPDNPIQKLSIDQLSEIFTGRLKNWKEVGGPDLPIELISRPPYSGTHAFFKARVLRRGNEKGPEEFAAGAAVVEDNGEILHRVSRQRGAVSYVGLGWVKRPEVKPIGVVAAPGQPAIQPSRETVRTGKYPIYRPLFIYTVGTTRGPARDLLTYILSAEGMRLVAKNDFIPPDTATPPPPAQETVAQTKVSEPLPPETPVTVVRVQFPTGGAILDAAARQELAAVVAAMKREQERHALVVGHSDGRGSREANRRVSLARAQAVAKFLIASGVPAASVKIESRGPDEPVATNESGAGRRQNRRVDVMLR